MNAFYNAFSVTCAIVIGSGGTIPPWVPAGATMFLDFKNGHYYASFIEGSVALDSFLIEDAVNWSAFNASTDIVAGVGLKDTGSPVLTSAAKAALVGGCSFLLTATLSGENSQAGVSVADFPDYTTDYGANMSIAPTFNVLNYGNTGEYAVEGLNKLSVTMSSGKCVGSCNGAALKTAASHAVWGANPNMAISSGHGGIIETLTVWNPPKDDADLPALSA